MSSKRILADGRHQPRPEVRAGDPFRHAGDRRECSACFGGYITITVEDDGEERVEPVRCRRCADDTLDAL
jgi:hypothetical protein